MNPTDFPEEDGGRNTSESLAIKKFPGTLGRSNFQLVGISSWWLLICV